MTNQANKIKMYGFLIGFIFFGLSFIHLLLFLWRFAGAVFTI